MSDNGYDTPLADGPSLALGPPQHYVLLGDSVSLICGTGLDRGNPQATITWTAPNGTKIMDNNRVNIENGPNIVRLNINRTLPSDAGMWRCDIRTESDTYVVNNGVLVQTDVTVIGQPIQHDIELIIIGSCYNIKTKN
ncbi:MAG: immunoglobulin domain-containing protein [Proteobacteria bacterium]|nr:immunoglobulin domain-containing protein [Pseudomonadota bacterium]